MAYDAVGMRYYNPQLLAQANVGNDDVMAQAHFNAIEQSGKIPGIVETAGSPAFRGQPDHDTFELSTPSLTGTVASAATGAVAGCGLGYWLLNNPIKDLAKQEINPAIYKSIDSVRLQEDIKDAQDAMKKTKEYNLAQLAKAESFEALPDDVKKYFEENNLHSRTPEEAKAAFERAGKKVEDYTLEAAAKKAKESRPSAAKAYKYVKAMSESELDAIKNAKNVDELKALITKHKELFGIKGTEEQIAKQVEELAGKGNEAVHKSAKAWMAAYEKGLKDLNAEIAGYFDSKTGKLVENLDDEAKAILKDFKWQQAKKYGKWGAIIAGAGAVLYGLFGGNKKSEQA